MTTVFFVALLPLCAQTFYHQQLYHHRHVARTVPRMAQVDHYAILGVESNATMGEIKRAYRSRVSLCHPDVDSSLNASVEFSQVSSAYACLKDPKARSALDNSLAAERIAAAAEVFVDDVVVPMVRDVGVPAIRSGAGAVVGAAKKLSKQDRVAAATGFMVAGPVGAAAGIAASFFLKKKQVDLRERQAKTDQAATFAAASGFSQKIKPEPPSSSSSTTVEREELEKIAATSSEMIVEQPSAAEVATTTTNATDHHPQQRVKKTHTSKSTPRATTYTTRRRRRKRRRSSRAAQLSHQEQVRMASSGAPSAAAAGLSNVTSLEVA